MNTAEEHDCLHVARALLLQVQLQSLASLPGPNYACRADEVWAPSISNVFLVDYLAMSLWD